MDLKKYKFIVASGCSYGRIPEFTFRPFNWSCNSNLSKEYGEDWLLMDDDTVVINTSMGSQGSDWQSDSTIYVCQKLLDLGVDSKNIYTLVEWSQWHRFSVHPFNYVKLDLDLFDWEKKNFYYDLLQKENLESTSLEPIQFLLDELEIYNSKKILTIPKLKDKIYISPCHMPMDSFSEIGPDFKYFLEKAQEIELSFPLENKIKTYLDNILRTQFFLEKLGIKYNFLFMQSTLSGWENNDGLLIHDLPSRLEVQRVDHKLKKIVINDDYNPINDNLKDLEIVSPETSNQIKQLNFDNIWFYENERYRRGGIDEWTIDNFKEVGYIRKCGDFYPEDIVSGFNNHPGFLPYTLLWNKVTTNCDFIKLKKSCEDFLTKRFWEDYESNDMTKNGITISKKEWYRVSKNE